MLDTAPIETSICGHRVHSCGIVGDSVLAFLALPPAGTSAGRQWTCRRARSGIPHVVAFLLSPISYLVLTLYCPSYLTSQLILIIELTIPSN